jgi:hypothetical protein
MFDLVNDFGTGFCTLRAKESPNVDLFLGDSYRDAGSWPAFGLSVTDCYAELNRLRNISFTSGGEVVRAKNGSVEVFEYPGGRNILLRDPDNHQILLFEDFGESK